MTKISTARPRIVPRSMKIAMGASLLLHAGLMAAISIVPAVGIVGFVLLLAITARIIGSRSSASPGSFEFIDQEREDCIKIAQDGLDGSSSPSAEFFLHSDCLPKENKG